MSVPAQDCVNEPIFIVGVGRSGTSLLQSMLATNSKINFLHETAFLRKYASRSKIEKAYDLRRFNAVRELFDNDASLSRIPIDETLITRLAQSADLDINIYKFIQEKAVQSAGCERFGDKDPRLIEFLPFLKKKFPKSFIIHILRDPRDVLCSKKKAAWSAGRNILLHAFANRVQIKLAKKFGGALFGERYILLKYEELLANPEQVLKSLCRQTGLPYEPKMLEFGNESRRLVSDRELSWKKETLGPLLRDNYCKWLTELSQFEVSLLEQTNRDSFELGKYDYSNSFKDLSFSQKVQCVASAMIIMIATPVYLFTR